jgi:hypothetical protein
MYFISFHFILGDVLQGQCNIADIVCPHRINRSSRTTGFPVPDILGDEIVI